MSIEEDIFKRCTMIYDKLLSYGFKKVEDTYLFSTNILNDSFRIDVTITPSGAIEGKVWDLDSDEEYILYKVDTPKGEFASKIRTWYEELLTDIKNKCTVPNYFIVEQTNRITQFIIEHFGDYPEFAWNDSPDAGIFRNPKNQKWYALIMNISKSKLDQEKKEVEIINVKLEGAEIQALLAKNGYYPAYHMNKKHWITLLLDDTLSDEEIITCIKKSYQLVEKNEKSKKKIQSIS